MFFTMSELEKIAQREKAVLESIAALQKEAEELAIARRVLSNLPDIQKPSASSSNGPKLGPKRPDGTPTTFEMTESVLADAEKAGKDGLTGKELVAAVKDKFWPGLQPGQILPIVYGFVRDERLRKTPGGKFKRLKKAEE